MIIKYTERETAERTAIEEKYKKLIAAAEREAVRLEPGPELRLEDMYKGVNKAHPQEVEAARERFKKAHLERELAGSTEWKAARARYFALLDELEKERRAFFDRTEQNRFAELGGSIEAIFEDAKKQAALGLEAIYNWEKMFVEQSKPNSYMSIGIVSTGTGTWLLDLPYTRKNIMEGLHLHYDALGEEKNAKGQTLTSELGEYILGLLMESPLVAQESTEESSHTLYFTEGKEATENPLEALGIEPQLYQYTADFVYSDYAVMPISKLIQKQTAISRGHGREALVDVGGRGEEKAIVKASITTDRELPAEAIEIQNVIGEMIQANGYRAIHVTRAQIWRAFACLEDGVTVSEQSQEYISDMVNLLAEAKGRLDFTQQIEKHKKMKRQRDYDYTNTVLEGPLVMRDETTVTAGGHETKGFILYRLPLFFLHSHLTNQITRVDKALLDTTAAKITDGQGKKHTVEARQNDLGFIMLKRHLARQVDFMKADKEANRGMYEGRRSFESIGKAVGLDEPTPKQIRTMRNNIELLCARWKIQGHIKEYALYMNRGSRAYAGVQIEV